MGAPSDEISDSVMGPTLDLWRTKRAGDTYLVSVTCSNSLWKLDASRDYLPEIPHWPTKVSPGASTFRSPWVGPALNASGPQVIGSTAIDQSRFGPPVKICVHFIASSPHSSA